MYGALHIIIIIIIIECISCAFSAAGIPVKKDPAGPDHKDGKRPDGCTLIPWCGGRYWLGMSLSHLHHSG